MESLFEVKSCPFEGLTDGGRELLIEPRQYPLSYTPVTAALYHLRRLEQLLRYPLFARIRISHGAALVEPLCRRGCGRNMVAVEHGRVLREMSLAVVD